MKFVLGTISTFSSWGLAPDLSIKPDVSAPGGQIYSTWVQIRYSIIYISLTTILYSFPLDRGSYATLRYNYDYITLLMLINITIAVQVWQVLMWQASLHCYNKHAAEIEASILKKYDHQL